MKTLICLILLICLSACSDSTPEGELAKPESDKALGQQPSEQPLLEQPTLAQDAEQSSDSQQTTSGDFSEPEISAEEMAKFEASILTSTRALTKKHADQSEQVSINELENLSATDRQTLTDKSAENTAKAAAEKAERQAASAALQAIDEP